ncbi:MAG: SDR family oxidoreductase [Acidobacteria bacterium]|nr:SDR family oxidoreductase [Acidobacteriota bacterium]
MRTLVTGSDGYIGAVLTPLLADQGHDVVGLDSGLFLDCLLGPAPRSGVRKALDIRDVRPSDLEGLDAVVHLAALSNDPLGALSEDATIDINQRGTLSLARAAREAGVKRFVFSSTCSVYGAQGGDYAVEGGLTLPLTAYARTKVAAEAELLAMNDDDFEVVSLRNATAYGFSPRLRLDLVVNYFTAGAAAWGKLTVKSDGLAWRPLVHVKDIARAFSAVLDAEAAAVAGEIFNVGSVKENYQVREIIDIVKTVIPSCEVEYAEGAGPDARSYRVDASKIERTIGFELDWTVEQGVREMKAAFDEYGMTAADLEGPRFHRMPKLKQLLASGAVREDMSVCAAAAAEA